MKAKTVKEIKEDYSNLEVSADQSVEDLIDLIHSADNMLKTDIEPLLHTKKEYKAARKKALAVLNKNHKLTDKKIQTLLKEAFDVLTWSRKHLPEPVADDIEEAHGGGFGEKFQTDLLKVINKDELMKWYNKNFEIGQVNEIEHTDDHRWNRVYQRIQDSIQRGVINNEKTLETMIGFLFRNNDYNLTEDDIQDAAWAAWEDSK